VPPQSRAPALLTVAACLGLAACGGSSSPGSASTPTPSVAPSQTVILFAAASTAKVMAQEIAAFEKQNPSIQVTGDYEGTQALLTKLQADPTIADVFLSADAAHMATAVSKGIVASSRGVAGNKLVVALAPGNPAHITSLADLGRSGVHLVLADTSVPAGKYAEQSFKLAETSGDAPKGFSTAALANVVSRETDVEAVVNKVAAGVADAGIVYATDALADHRIIALGIAARDQPPTVYPLAVTTQARAPAAAGTFVAFLLSGAGQKILHDAGFSAPPAPTPSP
jgi:molybdate transport system substrate-binding protein